MYEVACDHQSEAKCSTGIFKLAQQHYYFFEYAYVYHLQYSVTIWDQVFFSKKNPFTVKHRVLYWY